MRIVEDHEVERPRERLLALGAAALGGVVTLLVASSNGAKAADAAAMKAPWAPAGSSATSWAGGGYNTWAWFLKDDGKGGTQITYCYGSGAFGPQPKAPVCSATTKLP